MSTGAILRAMLPSRLLIGSLAGIGALLVAAPFAHLAPAALALGAGAVGALMAVLVGIDAHLSLEDWRRAPLTLERRLPHAFAAGAPAGIEVSIVNPGGSMRRGWYRERTEPALCAPALPLRFAVGPGMRATLRFEVTPDARGIASFEAGQILLRSVLGLLDWNLRIGACESRRVFPDFRRLAAFACLARDRRAAERGVTMPRRRGAGIEFDHLREYREGDPLRQIDWKATLRHGRPVTRAFGDARDESVMFLIDCGRRMRADDGQSATTLFDRSLDALMRLADVALANGDAVGAMTFARPAGLDKRFAPRKGGRTLEGLMAALGDLEPTPNFSDYVRAAADLIERLRKRSLVVLITSCGDEDSAALGRAVGLLRSHHLVVLANLREPAVGRIASQPLSTRLAVLEVAAAVEYEQRRRDMLQRLARRGAILIDGEPSALGMALVNRYNVLKRTGAL